MGWGANTFNIWFTRTVGCRQLSCFGRRPWSWRRASRVLPMVARIPEIMQQTVCAKNTNGVTQGTGSALLFQAALRSWGWSVHLVNQHKNLECIYVAANKGPSLWLCTDVWHSWHPFGWGVQVDWELRLCAVLWPALVDHGHLGFTGRSNRSSCFNCKPVSVICARNYPWLQCGWLPGVCIILLHRRRGLGELCWSTSKFRCRRVV